MKKYLLLLLIIFSTILFIGCGQSDINSESNTNSQPLADNSAKETENTNELEWDRRPMVMVDGELFLDTGKERHIETKSDVILRAITSTVEGYEIPTQNNQSNFGDGYGYQYTDENSIDIYINGKWIIFEKESS
ncbi:MAG: hypothetical protein ACOCV8_03990 [Spirochaetota bacterium]